MLLSVLAYTRTLTLLSLCLSATLPFPLPFKRCCDTAILINRNIDFSVFGSLISKVTPTSNLQPCLIVVGEARSLPWSYLVQVKVVA